MLRGRETYYLKPQFHRKGNARNAKKKDLENIIKTDLCHRKDIHKKSTNYRDDFFLKLKYSLERLFKV